MDRLDFDAPRDDALRESPAYFAKVTAVREALVSRGVAPNRLELVAVGPKQPIADNRAPLDGGMRGLAEIGPAVAELRTTLASLRTITRQLESRPADYLLGLEPTKEFTP